MGIRDPVQDATFRIPDADESLAHDHKESLHGERHRPNFLPIGGGDPQHFFRSGSGIRELWRVSSRIDYPCLGLGHFSEDGLLGRIPIDHVDRPSQQPLEISLETELLVEQVDTDGRGAELS